jgi:(S)-sulfolactate dehydrogenase
MADIVITEFMDEQAVETLRHAHAVEYDPTLVDDPERLRRMLPGVRALVVRNRTQVRGELLESASDLVVVGRLGVGLDNIDVGRCAQRGIEVCPATGANDIAVAEYVVISSMLLLRRAFLSSTEVTAGRWPREASIGSELFGKRLGLVGFGGIARETARRAVALGMPVSAYDPFIPIGEPFHDVTRVDGLESLLESADVISLHVPLSSSTRYLINAEAIAHMKPGAILINTARGGVVDEAALVQALVSGHLGGAAIDVFEHEPLTGDHAQQFDGVPNLILTPHVGGVTEESNVRVSRVTASNVLRVLSERPR